MDIDGIQPGDIDELFLENYRRGDGNMKIGFISPEDLMKIRRDIKTLQKSVLIQESGFWMIDLKDHSRLTKCLGKSRQIIQGLSLCVYLYATEEMSDGKGLSFY